MLNFHGVLIFALTAHPQNIDTWIISLIQRCSTVKILLRKYTYISESTVLLQYANECQVNAYIHVVLRSNTTTDCSCYLWAAKGAELFSLMLKVFHCIHVHLHMYMYSVLVHVISNFFVDFCEQNLGKVIMTWTGQTTNFIQTNIYRDHFTNFKSLKIFSATCILYIS